MVETGEYPFVAIGPGSVDKVKLAVSEAYFGKMSSERWSELLPVFDCGGFGAFARGKINCFAYCVTMTRTQPMGYAVINVFSRVSAMRIKLAMHVMPPEDNPYMAMSLAAALDCADDAWNLLGGQLMRVLRDAMRMPPVQYLLEEGDVAELDAYIAALPG